MARDYEIGQRVAYDVNGVTVRGTITKIEETELGVTYTFTTDDGQLGYIT